MTQKEKTLLFKDLCTRLPYGVIIHKHWEKKGTNEIIDINKKLDLPDIDYLQHTLNEPEDYWYIIYFKPYLRPMSSMTEEEKEEYCNLQDKFLCSSQYPVTDAYELFDWLNAHHFDYRGMIEKGFALPAPEGMYEIN